MTETDQEKAMQLRAKLNEDMEMIRKRFGTATQDYFTAMKKLGIEMNEQKIIEDYAKFNDAEKLDESYYEQYGEILDGEHPDRWLNSDVFMELIDRIIPAHYDFEETGDPFFIYAAVDEVCTKDLRKADQKDIEKIMRALVTYSRTRDQHILEEALEMPDMNGLIRELIRVCHNRDASFRKLVREMYECFEDMDPRIFPSVYKEAKKAR